MNDDLDLAPIEARAAAATEIDVKAALARLRSDAIDPLSYGIPRVGSFYGEDDAVFVAHARQDIDALCQDVRRLRAREATIYAILNGELGPDGYLTDRQAWQAIRAILEPEAPATSDPPA